MKKIISLVLAITLCMALTAPAWAETQLKINPGEILSGEDTISDDTICVTGDVIVASGASITFCGRLNLTTRAVFTIEPGATVTLIGPILFNLNTAFSISGTLTGQCTLPTLKGSFNLLPGGTVDLEVMTEDEANKLTEALSEYGATVEKINDGDYEYRVTAHVHDFSKGDCPCGEKAPAASTLSEGNIWIVCTIGAAAVIAVGAIVIVKKKRVN